LGGVDNDVSALFGHLVPNVAVSDLFPPALKTELWGFISRPPDEIADHSLSKMCKRDARIAIGEKIS
jgi:hypothetical protein